MADNKFQKTAINHYKLRLRGTPYVEGNWEAPEISFDMFGGHPQLLVWSKHPGEAEKTNEQGKPLHKVPIKASTSLPRLRGLFSHLRSLYGKNEPVTHVLKCKTVQRDEHGNAIKGKRVVGSKIVYGRHPEGYLFLEIRNAGRAVLPFPFLEDQWHEQVDDTGLTTLAEMSDHICEGFIKTIEDVMVSVFCTTYDPDFAPGKKTEKPKYSSGGSDNGWD